jgi:PASTA domain
MKVIDMRRVLAILAVLAALSGCGTRLAPPSSPPPPQYTPAVTTTTTPTLLTVPDVVGQNAAVAADRLKKAGFTNVGFGTVDGRAAVVLPENWSVKTQSAQPGDHLPADAKIVLGCARNG